METVIHFFVLTGLFDEDNEQNLYEIDISFLHFNNLLSLLITSHLAE